MSLWEVRMLFVRKLALGFGKGLQGLSRAGHLAGESAAAPCLAQLFAASEAET